MILALIPTANVVFSVSTVSTGVCLGCLVSDKVTSVLLKLENKEKDRQCPVSVQPCPDLAWLDSGLHAFTDRLVLS